jgi:glycosyltransferase involved in cell wall biosynthesis
MTTRYGFVSTYPPTLCGLATFTAALREQLVGGGDPGPVVRLVDVPQGDGPPEVAVELVAGDAASRQRAAEVLNGVDAVIAQHEYGVYGGPDGDEVLQLLDALTVPSIVVLHTVLTAPSPHQRTVLEAVCRAADAVVVMTAAARDRLAAYAVDLSRVSIVPHGAPPSHGLRLSARPARPTVLTWGLIGPSKGVQWGIGAMALLRDLDPAPRYVVAGQTHPKVLAGEGERYRESLQKQVAELGLADAVALEGHYQDAAALEALVDAADVVLLPYDSTEQVTSGVLIEAVAAHKPVVATRFPHAVELLTDGAGLLVPHRDPAAIAAALRAILTHPDVAGRMTATARQTAAEALWPAVADRYRDLADRLLLAVAAP